MPKFIDYSMFQGWWLAESIPFLLDCNLRSKAEQSVPVQVFGLAPKPSQGPTSTSMYALSWMEYGMYQLLKH
jgi:hypothetical protein